MTQIARLDKGANGVFEIIGTDGVAFIIKRGMEEVRACFDIKNSQLIFQSTSRDRIFLENGKEVRGLKVDDAEVARVLARLTLEYEEKHATGHFAKCWECGRILKVTLMERDETGSWYCGC